MKEELKIQNLAENFHCGFVAIIGQPNVGKSTLLNGLLDFKLSIVSPKPQTTRQRVLGIVNQPNAQIIFLDTPGLIIPKYELQSAMMKIANRAMEAADVLIVMADATSPTDFDFIRDMVTQRLASMGLPMLLVINKIDKVPKPELLPMMDGYLKLDIFKEVVPISAKKNDNVERLKSVIAQYLPVAKPFYPLDQLTEQPERFFVGEIIREKVFIHFDKEIPYSTEVQIEEFKERGGSKDFIRALIIVERDSQKAILIGKKGEALKRVGQHAREDIEKFLGRGVFLELLVKVKEEWRKDESSLRNFGYSD